MKFCKFYLFFFIIPFIANAKVQNFDTLANDNKCLTFQIKDTKNKILKNIYYDNAGRPINQKTFPSPSGLFLIHYDTSGVHSVDLTDNNYNGIPDFVDSIAYYCDYVYQKKLSNSVFSPLLEIAQKEEAMLMMFIFKILVIEIYIPIQMVSRIMVERMV
ncbi:MAG TPA: hypothetical protein P5545_08830, partial [Bacteroidota bacterium]|nr:hypothetical protein [Bacteroidota bacterium]